MTRNVIQFSLLLGLSFLTFTTVNAETNTKELRKQAEKAMRNGDFASAEKLWQQVLETNPNNIQNRLALSHVYLKQRKLLNCYEEAEKALKIEPDNARGQALVGATFLAAGNFTSARAFLTSSMVLNPDDSLALGNLALLDFYENRTQDCLIKLRRAQFLSPNEPDYVYAFAQASTRAENYRDAADAYDKFLRIAPATDTDRRDRIKGLIDFLRYLGTQKTLYEISGDVQTTVRGEIISGRPIIKVRVNDNEEPLKFVLDTGSGMTIISDETAKRLNIKPVAEGGMARAVGGGGKFPIVYGFLSSFQIGDARISKVPVFIRKFYSGGEKYDGYIGLSVISKFLTTFDYGNGDFTLIRRGKVEKDRKKAIKSKLAKTEFDNLPRVPLRTTASGFLSGEVKIEDVNVPLNFIIDTGASISVVSSEMFRQTELQKYEKNNTMRVFGAAGVADNVKLLVLPKLALGESSQDKIEAVVLNLDSINETVGFAQAGILGGNFLQKYRVTFDFLNETIVFELTKTRQVLDGKDVILGEVAPKR
ncbi:MAG: aspartyl protease family protein [Pyrinomonadaceae bacterium]|nr:aspartyl protease family protein [Pyrinomonadaceae bacterium]